MSCFHTGAQESLGLELSSLIEDPQNASVRIIAAEAYAKLTSGAAEPAAAADTQVSCSDVGRPCSSAVTTGHLLVGGAMAGTRLQRR